MELNRLKNLLEEGAKAKNYDTGDFREILAHRTQSTMSRIKKAAIIEIIIFVVAIAAMTFFMLYAAESIPPALKKIAYAALAFFLILYITLYVKVRKANPAEQSVRGALVRTIRVLSIFIRLYIYGTTVLVIMGYAVSTAYALRHQTHTPAFSADTFFLYILPGILLAFAAWAFMRWYAHRMFGKHLNKLKQYLADLAENQ